MSFRSAPLRPNRFGFLATAMLALLPVVRATRAQEEPTYKLPPKEVVDLVDAPPFPQASLDPTRRTLLLMTPRSLPSVAELARPELRLAGLRIDPRTNGPSREGSYTGFTLLALADRSERPIAGLPKEARLGAAHWAPDGSRFAFTATTDAAVELWIAELADATAHPLAGVKLNAAHGAAFHWLPDSKALVVKTVPADRGALPERSSVPRGPAVQETTGGKKAGARTYQDLLKDAHDDTVLEWAIRAQVERVTIAGERTPLGKPDLIDRALPSPDGEWLLVERTLRPFSRLVPIGRFPSKLEVWSAKDGKLVATVADLPLAEDIPIAFSAVRKGPRGMSWRADVPATLTWTEARDEGDPAKPAEVRDEVLLLDAPFTGQPRSLAKLALRAAGLQWSTDGFALVSESWWETRKTRTWIVREGAEKALLFERSSEDRYKDPGTPLTRRLPNGHAVLERGPAGELLLAGDGASPEGNRPFFDRLDLASKKTDRLFRSEAPVYERVVAVLDASHLLTSRESRKEPPNYFVRTLADEKAGVKASVDAITRFPHPTPALAAVERQLLRYQRADGVKLTAKLYTPPGWTKEKGPLPVLVWAYPQEFKSADAAGQVRDSPFRFVRVSPSSPLLLLTQGYAILEDPAMPIVGEGEKQPNDTYVEQLVASTRAAVDEVVRLGVGDKDRIAIAGHSYGAFMTANLLAHSDLFRAGIARSGAYNRTLTPFGFQSEERTLWQAPEVYARMSPFNHADRIDEPLLMIHGEADSNPGTFPLQSERLYNALKGHGATARLVLLPHESHGYQARESLLHVLWEEIEWLDRYVKNAKPREAKKAFR